MELRHLEYFRKVSQLLHFTKAADELGISQPSLSQQIRALEDEIGLPLFDRIGKKIALTEAGRILLAHTHNIFHELEQARSAIGNLRGLARGRLSIGALLTVTSYLLPPILATFHGSYPNIELSVQGLRTDEIRNGLLENRLDFGVMFLPNEESEFDCIPLLREELCLAVSRNTELASKPSVHLSVLDHTPSVLLPENYCLRQMINKTCMELGFTPRPVVEMTTLESLLDMVERGIGVTILPKPYLESRHLRDIAMIPVNSPILSREIGIVYRKDKYMCEATKAFIDLLTFAASNLERTQLRA